ncbi:MAG: hypothetical protein ACE5H4_01480 [Candidatus Thorarchaeota archaeon]
MKRIVLKGFLLAITLTLAVMPVAPVSAANNQGLEWGIAVGTRIDYTYEYHLSNSSLVTPKDVIERICVTIDSLPRIEDDICNMSQLWGSTYTLYWTNGSKVPILSPVNFALRPVGNWSLMTELILQYPTIVPESILDTSTLWGFNTSESWTNTRMHAMYEISKHDGIAHRLFVNVTERVNAKWGTSTWLFTRMFEPNDAFSVSLVLGLGLTLLVVVLASIYRWSRP